VIAASIRYALSVRGALFADLVDPIAGPFASLGAVACQPWRKRTRLIYALMAALTSDPVANRVAVDTFTLQTRPERFDH
jgi:hypothetical protein